MLEMGYASFESNMEGKIMEWPLRLLSAAVLMVSIVILIVGGSGLSETSPRTALIALIGAVIGAVGLIYLEQKYGR